MRIETKNYSELSEDTKSLLKASADREFANVEIIQRHVWAEPTLVFLGYEGDDLVSSMNVVDRMGLADGQPLRLFGLNNLITDPEHRQKGFAKQIVRAALPFMKDRDPLAMGLLFCANDLVNFYQKFGWRPFKGKVIFNQPNGEIEWTSNCLVHPLGRREAATYRKVHLSGLPW